MADSWLMAMKRVAKGFWDAKDMTFRYGGPSLIGLIDLTTCNGCRRPLGEINRVSKYVGFTLFRNNFTDLHWLLVIEMEHHSILIWVLLPINTDFWEKSIL